MLLLLVMLHLIMLPLWCSCSRWVFDMVERAVMPGCFKDIIAFIIS